MFKIRICPLCEKEFQPIGPSGYCKPCQKVNKKRYQSIWGRTEKGKANYARYRNKESYKIYTRNRYQAMDENIKKARYAVSNAVRDGKLHRPNKCQKCNKRDWGIKRSMIEAHHYKGYEPENWLVVEWLCTDCHRAKKVK
jgi:hypothetical protein